MPDSMISDEFKNILTIIENAQNRAFSAVNQEMIRMYWEIGAYLSRLTKNAAFGDRVIDSAAAYIAEKAPLLKGFNRRGLYRMKQFYETYQHDEFVSALLTQISWTNHLLILSKAKTREKIFHLLGKNTGFR